MYSTLRENNVPVFPTSGFLLAIVRQKGFSPWDLDIDMGILDTDIPELEAIADKIPYEVRVNWDYCSWWIGGDEVEINGELPKADKWGRTLDAAYQMNGKRTRHGLLDGQIFKLDEDGKTLRDCSHGKDLRYVERSTETTVPEDQLLGNETKDEIEAKRLSILKQYKTEFSIEDFDRDNFIPMPFYCTEVLVPPGYAKYLSAYYGEDWREVARNKCSRPHGQLFKAMQWHCHLPQYTSALDQPHELVGDEIHRGRVKTAECNPKEDEPPPVVRLTKQERKEAKKEHNKEKKEMKKEKKMQKESEKNNG